MCLASFHIKRDTEKSISANLGIFLPRQCPCSRTTVLKNTRRQAPTFFVLDETNKVVLKGADRFEVIEKLTELGIVEESVRDEFSKLNEN